MDGLDASRQVRRRKRMIVQSSWWKSLVAVNGRPASASARIRAGSVE